MFWSWNCSFKAVYMFPVYSGWILIQRLKNAYDKPESSMTVRWELTAWNVKHCNAACWGGISHIAVYSKPWGSRYRGHWVQTEQQERQWWERKKHVWPCPPGEQLPVHSIHTYQVIKYSHTPNETVRTLLSFILFSVALSDVWSPWWQPRPGGVFQFFILSQFVSLSATVQWIQFTINSKSRKSKSNQVSFSYTVFWEIVICIKYSLFPLTDWGVFFGSVFKGVEAMTM